MLSTKNIAKDPNFKRDDYTSHLVKILQLTAMWPLTLRNTKLPKLTCFHIIFYHTTLVHMIYILIMDTRKHMENGLQAITFDIANIVAYIMASLMMLYFQVYSAEIQQFITDLNKSIRPRSTYGFDFVTIERNFKIVRKAGISWNIIGFLGVFHLAVMPILNGERKLPIATEYPFETLSSPRYELLYIWQILAQIMVGLAFTAYSSFYMSICLLICGQFDVLSCSFKNLRNSALLEQKSVTANELKKLQMDYLSSEKEAEEYFMASEFSENLDQYPNNFKFNNNDLTKVEKHKLIRLIELLPIQNIKKYITHPIRTNSVLKQNDNYIFGLDDEINRAIKRCVEHHLEIIALLNRFEEIFSPLGLIKALQVSLFLCTVAFTAGTSLESGDAKTVNLLEYVSLSANDLFMFCYPGHMVTYMSERVRLALLRSDWRLFGGSARRSASIVLASSSKPINLTGGKFYLLNMGTFAKLMSASFSYYTLLKNLQD